MLRPSRLIEYPSLEQGSDEWLATRRSCSVTASEVAAAVGCSKYKSRATLLKEKLDPRARAPPNQFMQYGTHYEDVIADAYASVFSDCALLKYGMNVAVFDESGLRLGASPDRVVCCGDEEHLMEIKYTSTDDYSVPAEHVLQMLAQAYCFDKTFVEYVKWGPSSVDANGCMQLSMCRVHFAPELWNDHVLPALQDFHYMRARKIACNRPTTQVRQLRAALQQYVRYEAIEL